MQSLSFDLEERHCASETKSDSHHHTRQSFLASRYVWIHHTHIWRPPTDVCETEQMIRVQAEVAGMERADFTVSLEGRLLRITGVRSGPSDQRLYHQLEIHNGEFMTEVELPAEVQVESLHAHYHDGFLVVELLKRS